MTDAELIERYLTHLAWLNRSKNTIDIRRTYLSHLSMTLGPFCAIKPKALCKWLADPTRNLEASSQSTYLSTYRQVWDDSRKAEIEAQRALGKIPQMQPEGE